MSVLKINFILEEEIIMYEDDQHLLWSGGEDSPDRVYAIKVDDYRYCWLSFRGYGVGSLGDAKGAVEDMRFFLKFEKKTFPKLFGGYKEKLICGYCGGDAIGEAEVFLRKITIYKRPPKGAKDMKINAGNSPYFYRLGTRAAYCKKCGSTE